MGNGVRDCRERTKSRLDRETNDYDECNNQQVVKPEKVGVAFGIGIGIGVVSFVLVYSLDLGEAFSTFLNCRRAGVSHEQAMKWQRSGAKEWMPARSGHTRRGWSKRVFRDATC